VWPHKEFPLIKVGQIVLNRNPDNYFAQVEQVGFDVANMPPGIEPSPDKMLQGRMFSYLDTQRYRLGANHFQIPINTPFVNTITPTIRDGVMVVNDNMDGAPNYFPNSYLKATTNPRYKSSRYRATSPDVDRYESGNEDNFSQVRIFWEKVLDDDQRERLVQNLAESMKNAYVFLQKRMVNLLSKVHPDYGNVQFDII
ncbi:catalase-like protein, partial [Leptotrombidium deliense]